MLKFPHFIMKKIKFIFSTWRYQKMQLSKGSLNFLKIHIFIIFRVHKSIPSQQISWYTPSDLKTPQELCGPEVYWWSYPKPAQCVFSIISSWVNCTKLLSGEESTVLVLINESIWICLNKMLYLPSPFSCPSVHHYCRSV